MCQNEFLASLLYINDLPRITNDNAKITLFADDTNIIITNPNLINFKKNVNNTIKDINEWFHANLLFLNRDKTHYMQFMTKNSPLIDFDITHGKRKIAYTNYKIFRAVNRKDSFLENSYRYHCT